VFNAFGEKKGAYSFVDLFDVFAEGVYLPMLHKGAKKDFHAPSSGDKRKSTPTVCAA
jgi:hypothetical protein